MKLKPTSKFYMRATVVLAVLLWVAATLLSVLQVFAEGSGVNLGVSKNVTELIQSFFFVCIIVYYHFRIKRVESGNYVDLLWRVFAIGLVTTITSLIIELFYSQIAGNKLGESLYLKELLFNINFALITIFLISTFTVWKRLILYQKSKRLIAWWRVFETTLMLSIFFNQTDLILQDSIIFQIAFGVLTLMALILSANLKWVAYLNFKQKWKSILLVLLITIYLFYFFSTIFMERVDDSVFDDIENLFILSLFTFLLFYSIFSLLVILFNLPTSSVFERKMEEAFNFQRLSQSIQQGENEEEIFDILLSSSMSAVYADAGWLEIDREGEETQVRTRSIGRDSLAKLHAEIAKSKQRSVLK